MLEAKRASAVGIKNTGPAVTRQNNVDQEDASGDMEVGSRCEIGTYPFIPYSPVYRSTTVLR